MIDETQLRAPDPPKPDKLDSIIKRWEERKQIREALEALRPPSVVCIACKRHYRDCLCFDNDALGG